MGKNLLGGSGNFDFGQGLCYGVSIFSGGSQRISEKMESCMITVYKATSLIYFIGLICNKLLWHLGLELPSNTFQESKPC